MTDIERHGSVAARLADMLMRYQSNRTTLFDWMHPDWRGSALARLPDGDSPGTRLLLIRAAETWLRAAGCAPPPLAAFRGATAPLAALPVHEAMCALRLRALHFRRAELRYWVDRESRERVSLWLGRNASAALRWLIEMPNAPAVDRLMRDYGMASLDELDGAGLAWEGYCHFAHAGLCKPSAPLALLRFAWGADVALPSWLSAYGTFGHKDVSVQFMSRLPDFFQEHTWSSG
ncbi:type III secretion protein HrpB4 [Paraburkholderia rhizosphaerae]|uniref:Type III secretion system (T3SS) protein HrpB4 n=1 Tax=Paraburkholderia rhizosphaerae TaxID=480658 RepID=A0A4R8LNE0_9BURK|nr:type III secretion protein HrpB4 [Paraburkholderia rhizosphaerae]TDY45160.1 type III secretion system (T3SS) protein HrpB4 [Paraburkholderia rhizosphaerae]